LLIQLALILGTANPSTDPTTGHISLEGKLEKASMTDIKTDIINTTEQIGKLVDWLVVRHAPPKPFKPTMYIDLEGVNLCREGSISILTLLIDTGTPITRVCLVDVRWLGLLAFNTTGIKNKSLKDILEDEDIRKIFFYIRNDSDALFANFDIALQGIEDVQLMENATRATTRSRKYLNGLAKCVENDGSHGSDFVSWKLAKEKGERLYKAEHGGSYEIFNQRPIPDDIISYCVGDVQYLPKLWDKFQGKTKGWRDLVKEATEKRVETSQKPEYQPHGPDRTLSPWSEEQNRALDVWNQVPPSQDDFDDDDFLHDLLYESGYISDDGPTSCRDIINNCDMDYYYSD
jgi:exonuclease 3'-5' domain-containing protein 1